LIKSLLIYSFSYLSL